MQISERLCTCSSSKGPVLATEHQNVFFLTQHRASRSDPVVHPSPRSSSVSLGAVADPARPGNGILADTHPQPPGEGKRKSHTKQHHRAWRQSAGGCGAPGAAGGAGSPSPPSAGRSGGTGTSGRLRSPDLRRLPGAAPGSQRRQDGLVRAPAALKEGRQI